MRIVQIRTPIWNDKWNKTYKPAIGISERELSFDNDNVISIEITYKRKTDGVRIYPYSYWIYKSIVRRMPIIRKKTATIYIVPIDALNQLQPGDSI